MCLFNFRDIIAYVNSNLFFKHSLMHILKREGHYYENQNFENQKERQKKIKASEHQKCLFSSSLLRQSDNDELKRHFQRPDCCSSDELKRQF